MSVLITEKRRETLRDAFALLVHATAQSKAQLPAAAIPTLRAAWDAIRSKADPDLPFSIWVPQTPSHLARDAEPANDATVETSPSTDTTADKPRIQLPGVLERMLAAGLVEPAQL